MTAKTILAEMNPNQRKLLMRELMDALPKWKPMRWDYNQAITDSTKAIERFFE